MRLTVLTRVRDRVYSDFLMASRLAAYARMLEVALEAGYQVTSVGTAWSLIQAGGLDPGRRHLVLRHDVDTDPRTAGAMWEIDRGLGVESSWFFRLSTLDTRLMAAIGERGSEASYHYEELSTVAKRRGLRSGSEALAHVPEAQDQFAANVEHLRATTGLPMRVVAAHGDFVNRRLGVPNWKILDDPEFRRTVNVDLETYDKAFLAHLPSRHIDAPPPRFWEPTDPVVAIRAGEPVISVLVHPRQWRADRMVNARDNLQRTVEGLRFELRARPRRQG